MTFKPIKFEDIVTPDYDIDGMHNLTKSLGKAKTDRIRIHGLGEATGASRRTRIVENPHRDFMQRIKPHAGGPIDDIISGIASLDSGGDKSLEAERLHVILQSYQTLSSENLMAGLAIGQRQARRYLAAAKLCIKHISNHRSKSSE